MKRLAPITTIAAALTICTSAFAQQVELPRPSPVARVMQTVGLTEVTVDYSSPGVKGRKIWGTVVPYDQPWRAGANTPTKITFSKDVTIGNTPVPAGTYPFFIIPGKTTWTLVLSKNPNMSVFNYKRDDDLLRLDVKPQPAPMRERLAYLFSDFADQTHATIDLEWEKVRVGLPVKMATAEQVEANIKNMQDNASSPYVQAARYELEQSKNYDEGITLIDKAIAMKETWIADWTKAQLEAAKGNKKDAHALAVKADELGQKVPPAQYFFKDEVQKAVNEWKGK
jgi:hypothetical protein